VVFSGRLDPRMRWTSEGRFRPQRLTLDETTLAGFGRDGRGLRPALTPSSHPTHRLGRGRKGPPGRSASGGGSYPVFSRRTGGPGP